MTGLNSAPARRATAILTAALLAVSLASCAPEPDDIAGAPDKSGEKNSESWSAENPDMAAEKKTELPASFPKDTFVVPEDAVIDDAGERDGGSWFVVLRATDIDAGDALWARVIDLGAFSATDVTVGENRETFATLTSAALSVDALMIPQEDGSVLLSYDISSL